MVLSTTEAVGTAGFDGFQPAGNQVSFGLEGEDSFVGHAGLGLLHFAFGGAGDDIYTGGSGLVVVEGGGSVDGLILPMVLSSGGGLFTGEIDGRHLVLADPDSGSLAIIADWQQEESRIEAVQLADQALGWSQFSAFAQSSGLYRGDLPDDALTAFGIDAAMTSQISATIDALKVREQEIIAGVGDGGDPDPDVPQYVEDIARLYEAGLDRSFDPEGVNFWIDQHEIGLSMDAIGRGFLNSPEFVDQHGLPLRIDNADFVNIMYNNVLGRDAEGTGYDFWLDQMNQGLSHEQVLIGFALSPENVANSAYVETLIEVTPGYWDLA